MHVAGGARTPRPCVHVSRWRERERRGRACTCRGGARERRGRACTCHGRACTCHGRACECCRRAARCCCDHDLPPGVRHKYRVLGPTSTVRSGFIPPMSNLCRDDARPRLELGNKARPQALVDQRRQVQHHHRGVVEVHFEQVALLDAHPRFDAAGASAPDPRVLHQRYSSRRCRRRRRAPRAMPPRRSRCARRRSPGRRPRRRLSRRPGRAWP